MLQYLEPSAAGSFSLRRLWDSAVRRWLDGVEHGWSIPLLLIAFVAVWVMTLGLAYSNAGLHPDVLETWSLGREMTWGNSKHPPLMGWMARIWTFVFPVADWSLQLLAMTNAAIALWAVDLITRRFVSGDKRVMVLLLLMLLPAYQFHAQRFNANSVLLATWPVAIYGFLRSYETRSLRWAALSGAMAGFAMLGKYYSIFLVLSLCVAAILHPQRRQYLLSAAPWVSVLAGLFVIIPHINWLVESNFLPFSYAMRLHGGLGSSGGASKALLFAGGVLAWLLVPIGVWMLLTRSRVGALLNDIGRVNGGLLLLLLVLFGTLAFPVLAAIVIGTSMPALWSLQGLFLAVVVVVCASRVADIREQAVKLTTAVALFSLVLIAAAPLHAYYRNTHPFKEGRNFYLPATEELLRRWHNETNMPLALVSGNENLALAAAFYGQGHPIYHKIESFDASLSSMPDWMSSDNWAALCFANDPHCGAWIDQVGKLNRRLVSFDFEVQSSYLGTPGVTARIRAVMLLPPNKPSDEPDAEDDDEFVEYGSQRRLR